MQSLWSMSLIAILMRHMCTLQHQTGAQYSAVDTRAKAVVRRTAAPTPYPDPASHFIRATHEVSFPHSDSRCRWYKSDFSSFTPRYVGIWVEDTYFLSRRAYDLFLCCSDGRQLTLFLTN